MTALDLITAVMIDIGALSQGETPSNEEAADILQRLNDMLDRWSIERLSVYTIQAALYNLTANKGTYLIGPGAADFSVPRPIRLERANFVQAQTLLKFELELINAARWAAIVERDNVAQVPLMLYDDYANPISSLNLNPVPKLNGQLELFTWIAVSQIAGLATSLNFPPGYSKAIQKNLAVDIAASFARPLPPELVQLALDSKADIQRFNAEVLITNISDIAAANPVGGTQPATPSTSQS